MLERTPVYTHTCRMFHQLYINCNFLFFCNVRLSLHVKVSEFLSYFSSSSQVVKCAILSAVFLYPLFCSLEMAGFDNGKYLCSFFSVLCAQACNDVTSCSCSSRILYCACCSIFANGTYMSVDHIYSWCCLQD